MIPKGYRFTVAAWLIGFAALCWTVALQVDWVKAHGLLHRVMF